jgi:hypothetical protein
MTTATHIASIYRRRWRQQILSRRDAMSINARRGLIAMYVHEKANLRFPFVELNSLSTYLVYEDEVRCTNSPYYTRSSLRFCMYVAKQVSHGVEWGGRNNSRLFKDLTLCPSRIAQGQRLGLSYERTLRLALELDRSLSRAACTPSIQDATMRLPRLWAGYRASYLSQLHGAGPEFEFECGQSRTSPENVLKSSERQFDGLTLLPLEFVSHQLDLAVTVYAEMRRFPLRQVFRIERFPDDLTGYWGATAFDFYGNRHRRYSAAASQHLTSPA